jgi:hypothetical protein
MALQPGTRFGPYEILELAGAGARFLYFQFLVPSAAAPQNPGPDHTSGLMIAMNWAASLEK